MHVLQRPLEVGRLLLEVGFVIAQFLLQLCDLLRHSACLLLEPLQLVVQVLANGLVVILVLLGERHVLPKLFDGRLCVEHGCFVPLLLLVDLFHQFGKLVVFLVE